MNGIPSIDIQTNILSYLPSNDYRKIPVISKHFRDIMKKNPFIYNKKRYAVEINLNLPNDGPNWKMVIDHKYNKNITFKPTQDKQIDINKILIPFRKINTWRLYGSYDENGGWYFQNVYINNDFMINLVSNSNNNIKSLEFDHFCEKKIINHFPKSITNKCQSLKFIGSSPVILSKFANLKCLEIKECSDMNVINSVLQNCSNSLFILSLFMDNKWNESKIIIPPNIEWLRLYHAYYGHYYIY